MTEWTIEPSFQNDMRPFKVSDDSSSNRRILPEETSVKAAVNEPPTPKLSPRKGAPAIPADAKIEDSLGSPNNSK
ncbi:MAG: hypothetical protein WBQ86_23095 [Candidatus Binatus sp.]